MSNTEDKVTDPVCGMTFRQDKAVAEVEFGDRTYHFCTAACREQFDADPGRYAQPGVAHEPGSVSGQKDLATSSMPQTSSRTFIGHLAFFVVWAPDCRARSSRSRPRVSH